jgi:hypothetical protein
MEMAVFMDGFKKKDERRHHGGLYQSDSNSPTMSPLMGAL